MHLLTTQGYNSAGAEFFILTKDMEKSKWIICRIWKSNRRTRCIRTNSKCRSYYKGQKRRIWNRRSCKSTSNKSNNS